MKATIVDQELLSAIVKTIVQIANPERVILFGSRARGTASGDSDYDFLVVVKGVENEREVSRLIYRALLSNKVSVAVDVVVVSEKVLERHRESHFLIYPQALREGRVLYERAPHNMRSGFVEQGAI